MRHIILLLSLFGLLGYACSEDDKEEVAPVVRPDASGTWTDPRDGITYRWVRFGNQEWLSENMRGETAVGNFVSEEDITEEEFLRYGYLYDFEAAQVLATDGWRLPSDEDWQELECHLGMSQDMADAEGWRGDFVGELMTQDSTGTGLFMQYGGYWHDLGGTGVRAFQVDGIYWSSTRNESLGNYVCAVCSPRPGTTCSVCH